MLVLGKRKCLQSLIDKEHSSTKLLWHARCNIHLGCSLRILWLTSEILSRLSILVYYLQVSIRALTDLKLQIDDIVCKVGLTDNGSLSAIELWAGHRSKRHTSMASRIYNVLALTAERAHTKCKYYLFITFLSFSQEYCMMQSASVPFNMTSAKTRQPVLQA